MHGIRWFNCPGPLGTVADEVTCESIVSLRALQCEVTRPGARAVGTGMPGSDKQPASFACPGGWYDRAGRQ